MRSRWSAWVLGACMTLALVLPPAGIAATKPERPHARVSVSHITADSATVTAVIDPNGAATEYLVWQRVVPECAKQQPSCEIAFEERVIGEGTIAAGKAQKVIITLELGPEQPCTVWVEASNSMGETVSRSVHFKTPPERR